MMLHPDYNRYVSSLESKRTIEDALDDSCSCRSYLAKGMDMRHDIMASFLFLCGRYVKLLWVEMLQGAGLVHDTWPSVVSECKTYKVCLHLLDGLVRYRQAKLLLRNREV